jgi:hypothetical protein
VGEPQSCSGCYDEEKKSLHCPCPEGASKTFPEFVEYVGEGRQSFLVSHNCKLALLNLPVSRLSTTEKTSRISELLGHENS